MTQTLPDLLVVDDDPAIVAALERGLRLEGFAVRAASGGRAALRAVEERTPDLIVLDVNMPDLDGVSVTKHLRADGVDIPICILSARDEIDDRVAGLEAGADDYLVKPFALAELIARLRALQRRRPAIEREAVTVGDLHIDVARRVATRGGRDLGLTQREFELLVTLARNADLVLTRDQLLEQVWGYDFETDSNVVDVFVSYVRRKLEAGGESRMLQTVRGVGFALRP
jgi:two-component system response regulator PrrA